MANFWFLFGGVAMWTDDWGYFFARGSLFGAVAIALLRWVIIPAVKKRFFMKKTFAIIILPGLLTSCSPGPPVDYVSKPSLFSGDVTAIMTETTQKDGMGGTRIISIQLQFEVRKPGTYLFEGWVANYRSRDTMAKKWEYQVTDVPFKVSVEPRCSIYRLEATRVVEDKIERATVNFRYHGITKSFNAQGTPMAGG